MPLPSTTLWLDRSGATWLHRGARAVLCAIAVALAFAGAWPTLMDGAPIVEFEEAHAQQRNDIPDGYAHLLMIANFDITEVTINGVHYPYEWIFGDMEGVLLPSGRTYEIVVSATPEQRRTYRVTLGNREHRVMMVSVENIGRAPPPAPVRSAREVQQVEESEDGEDEPAIGYLGVSSSPRGIVYVDGSNTGQRTPARRIELEPGRHEVTVFYEEDEEMSEVKHVLIRAGVNTNVFFRQNRD